MAYNVLLHATIALFVPCGIHSAMVADIFELSKLKTNILNIQSVQGAFYLIKSLGCDMGVDLGSFRAFMTQKSLNIP
jgi:hypothetical protein